ncbi:MAG: FAD-dependent oxidoreductase [Oscillibacter sp.]
MRSGRRSPVKSGEQFTIPCDMVISAVGEQVDADLMAANGIEMERKGPAFETNIPGVYCAGDAHRGPATVVEGIADAARFAEIVIGHPHILRHPCRGRCDRVRRAGQEGYPLDGQ